MTRDLLARMGDAGRPFILGSECDVLHVAGAGDTIRRKVEAMLGEGA
jgi:Fe2+ transport system protein FeoA